jgi:hypothetical protein
MSTSILLAILALSGATSFRSDAQALYAGCQAHEEGARGRFYACRDCNSAILELANTAFEAANQLELTRMALRTVLPGAHREERVMMNLGASLAPLSGFCRARRPMALDLPWRLQCLQEREHVSSRASRERTPRRTENAAHERSIISRRRARRTGSI